MIEFLVEFVKEFEVFIVVGMVEKDEKGNLYNFVVFVGLVGWGYIGKYWKIYFFNREKFFFRFGNFGFYVFNIGIVKVGVMICFDWFFFESVRMFVFKGVDVIVYLSNFVMFYVLRVMLIRVFENRVYMIMVNRIGEEFGLRFIGKSIIVLLRVEVFVMGSEDKEEVGVVEIDLLLVRDKRINEMNDIFKDRRL